MSPRRFRWYRQYEHSVFAIVWTVTLIAAAVRLVAWWLGW
jgi:hypothetical protein